MTQNPLKWPSTEQLGKEFCEALRPALKQWAAGCEELDPVAQAGLARLDMWLSAPCVGTVKLDGTNVGVDNTGTIVGRNLVVEPGAAYQKVDVWTLLADYPSKAEDFRVMLESSGEERIQRAMLYGELMVNGKHDYSQAGIMKAWLCFGAMLNAEASDGHAAKRLTAQLCAAGFCAKAHGTREVLVSPNAKLHALLAHLGVCCVSGGYRPAGVDEAQWTSHDGEGLLPCFRSMRQFLESDWAQRLLLPADGVPLCEGIVICSEADGTLFKWKHAGEELGKVPTQLGNVVRKLRELDGKNTAVPADLLAVFERLLLVATTVPRVVQLAAPKAKAPNGADSDALAVWHSALTKFDALEDIFERGDQAMAASQQHLIEQVAQDLVKDYGAVGTAAKCRATRVVRCETGKAYGAWKQARASQA